MVNNSCNVSSDLKTKICDIKQEDIFYKTFATEFSSGKDLEYIEIFKLLAYSVNFSEEKSVYDDLESNVEVLSEYIERKNITKKLNYHALAITVYSKAIAQSCLDYDKIISILDENLVSSEIEECVSFKQEEKLACEHIRTLFMQTLNNQLTDDDKIVLRVMSLMPDFGISLNQLQKYTGLTNNNPIYCKLKPLCWINIDISKVVTIHSIIRDIVLEELKPDTEK